jgi:hypothetical protein
MNHFTDLPGWNAIRSQSVWLFRAAQPPGGHPFGAYFTTLDSTDANLAVKLRIPREKLGYVFGFRDRDPVDLLPLPGGRGRFIFYSSNDYAVDESRQIAHGATGL